MTIEPQNIDKVCELCKNEINICLSQKGYRLTKTENHPEAFGSKYWVWTNQELKHCFRFIWEGKDQLLVLEDSPYLNDPQKTAWADLTIVPFDPSNDKLEYWNYIKKSITEEIR